MQADQAELRLRHQAALDSARQELIASTEAGEGGRQALARLSDGVDAILQDISRNERTPQSPLEVFFVMTKQAAVQGYYTSEIGIHQELRYKGNKFLREFVGCETEDGKDCPHCGQKAVR